MKRFLPILTLALAVACSRDSGFRTTAVPAWTFPKSPTLLETSAWPHFGTMNGVAFESRWIEDTDGRTFVVYLCYRPRKPGDLKVGEGVYGTVDAVSKEFPREVISAIVLAIRESPFDEFRYYELPKEMYRCVTEPDLGGPSTYQTYFTLSRVGRQLIVFHHGSDGAGTYSVNWVIDTGVMKATRVIQAHESPEDAYLGWLELAEIAEPVISESDKPVE